MVKKDIFFIQETVATQKLEPLSEDTIASLGIPILEEQRREGRKGGTVFSTVLQEADVVNKNKRSYNKTALNSALKEESVRFTEGNFFGELDHPSDSDPSRFTKVELKNSCFRVLKYDWDGNVLTGVGETLCNGPGKDMQALILENGIKLGFSLRAMGKTQINPKTGITEVHSPMKVFCYDCVSSPSHSNAVMSKVLTESSFHVAKDCDKNLLLENEEQMRYIVENYGCDIESLVMGEKIVVNPNSGMAIIGMDNRTIRTFLKEDTISKFTNVARRYFL